MDLHGLGVDLNCMLRVVATVGTEGSGWDLLGSHGSTTALSISASSDTPTDAADEETCHQDMGEPMVAMFREAVLREPAVLGSTIIALLKRPLFRSDSLATGRKLGEVVADAGFTLHLTRAGHDNIRGALKLSSNWEPVDGVQATRFHSFLLTVQAREKVKSAPIFQWFFTEVLHRTLASFDQFVPSSNVGVIVVIVVVMAVKGSNLSLVRAVVMSECASHSQRKEKETHQKQIGRAHV